MNTNTTIMGDVLEPYDGVAAFVGFYTGPASIRDHGDYMEVAFFAASVKPRLPMKGRLDGEDVIVTGVRTRDLDPESSMPRRRGALHSIIATVTPATST